MKNDEFDFQPLPGMPPEVAEKIRQAIECQKVASAIADRIAERVSVEELSVSYSVGSATFSGRAGSEVGRTLAEEIAMEYPGVEKVFNCIVVGNGDGGWFGRLFKTKY